MVGNWSSGTIPGTGDDVIVNGGTFAPSSTASRTISSLTIGSGITVTFSAGTLSVTNAMVINGTLNFTGAGCLLTGVASTSGTGLLKTVGTGTLPIPSGKTWSFDIEYAGANQNVLTGTYAGDLFISGSGIKALKGNIAVGGNFVLNASSFYQNNATSYTVTINGNLLINGGTYNFDPTNGDPQSLVYLKGNLINAGGILTTTAPSITPNGKIIFNGSGTRIAPQIFSSPTTANVSFTDFDISNGTVVQLANKVNLTRSSNFPGTITILNGGILDFQTFGITETGAVGQNNLLLNSGGTLITSSATGLNAIPSTSTVMTMNSGGNYEFQGAATGTFTNTTMNNLTINNGSTTTSTAQNIVVNGLLTINNSNTFNLGSNILTGASMTTSGTGTLRTQNTSALPIPIDKTWNFALLYDGTTSQTVVRGSYDGGLTMTNGIKVFAVGPTNVGGNWTSTSSSNIDLAANNVTINFDGPTNQTITDGGSNGNAGVVFRAINFSQLGTKLFSGKTAVSGNWTSTGGKIDFLTNSVDVSFTGTSAQSLSDAGSDAGNGVFFKNVYFSGGGTKTMSGAGKFSVAGSGVLAMAASTQLDAGGILYLKSAENNTATVANIPATSSIISTVFVERFMRGDNDNRRRGYRLMSSPVHFSALIDKKYDIFNLKQNLYISGNPDAAPFDVNDASKFDTSPNHNPTIYHYRESSAGPVTQFDYYGISLPLNNPEFNVGEGMYVFYRGLRQLTDGTGVPRFVTTVKPENNTLSFKGIINQQGYTISPLAYTSTSSTADGFN
ncbi:MAG: hypothetical protein EOO89_08050, partial [Pedobacter sp.]